jgi:hypothetical protein
MAIALSCPSCDKALKVKDELAGRRVKCPGCGGPILVTVDEVPAEEMAVQEPPRRKARVAEDEDEDRPRKKKKKKKKSNRLLWIALGGGAVFVLLLVVVGVVVFFATRPAEETKSTQQAKTKSKKKQDPQPKFDPGANDNPRPKGGIPRAMDVQEVKNAMKQIGLAYHNCVTSNNKAPTKLQDLMQFLERNAMIEQMLADGGPVVLIYGVRPQDMTDGSSNTLLAYEKDADNRGLRVVLFGDGSVDMLPDDEFQAKPKAQPRK